jgi:hypothetical protein
VKLLNLAVPKKKFTTPLVLSGNTTFSETTPLPLISIIWFIKIQAVRYLEMRNLANLLHFILKNY